MATADPYTAFLEALPTITDAEAKVLEDLLTNAIAEARTARWQPYPWQTPPGIVPTLGAWMMLGGRGTGKTEGAARYVDAHMRGPACDPRIRGGHRALLVAPTIGDAVESCINGPSGLRAMNPGIVFKGGIGGHHVRWPNGAEARVHGAYTPEDAERLRAAGNRCLVWLEEAAAMRHLGPAMEHTSLGLRIGNRPHYVISTTPKPRREIRDLVKDPTTLLTRGRTHDATFLDPLVRARLIARYANTRLGRQELDAEILDDTEGALWTMAMLEATRFASFDLATPWPSLSLALGRIVTADHRAWRKRVGVDPPGETAECGIIVAAAPVNGKAGTDHAVVLDDATIEGPPEVWGAQVVAAAKRWGADVVVEANQGGDMCRATIHNVDSTVRVEKIRAKESKYDRAEPVSALYANGWIHHLGYFPDLEDQLTTWVPSDAKSPDRLDALVHCVNSLLRPLVVSSSAKITSRQALASSRL